MTNITVLLADDHPVVRMGLRRMIENSVGVDVIAEASDGQEALQLIRDLQPDVMLLDISMPKMSGVDVARAAAREGLQTHILVLSGMLDPVFLAELHACGVCGYMLKDEAQDHLIEAIRAAARGEKGWFSRAVASEMTSSFMPRSRPSSVLSPREVQVLEVVTEGKTNREIAASLKLSEKTVEKHLSSIYAKLGVSSRTEAAMALIRERKL